MKMRHIRLLVSRALLLISGLLPAGLAWAQLSPFYQWQNVRPTGANISDVAALNDSTAFAIQRFDNTGLRTTNRGRTWTRVSLGSAIGDLWAERVSFAGDSVGLVGQNTPELVPFGQPPRRGAKLMRTTNGGRTWQPAPGQPLPIGSAVIDLQLVTRQVGYVLYLTGAGSFLIRTTDGGLTWGPPRSFRPVPGFFGRVTDLCFVSTTTGWVAAGSDLSAAEGSLLKTTDGGLTWHRQTLLGDSTLVHEQVVFADAQHGWLLTRNALNGMRGQHRTIDGGRSWQPMVGVENTSFLAAASAQRVVSRFACSTDGGQTWQPSTGCLSERFALRPSGTGYGTTGPQQTTDFGATWTGRTGNFDLSSDIQLITALDARRAWTATRVACARTLDRGAHWAAHDLGQLMSDSLDWVSSGPANAWAFPDLDTAYLITSHGTHAAPFPYHSDVLRTSDGGRTWHPQLLPARTPPIRALAFYNARRGCGVGDSGAIVLTYDGGQTWQRIPNDSTLQLVSVAWGSPTLLLAVGVASGQRDLMRSTDGGLTWTHQGGIAGDAVSWRTPTEAWLSGYMITPPAEFSRSTDAGRTWQTVSPAPTPPVTTNAAIRATNLGAVIFTDSLHGWYRDYRPIHTADGGRTWQAGSPSYALPPAGPYVDRYNAWLFGGVTAVPCSILHYSEKFVQADTALAQTTYCAGDTLRLAYMPTGTFGADEQAMVAELSDAHGRFGPYPLVVGQGSASPLPVVLPLGTPTGSGYLLRVSRADHSVIGGDNRQPLTVYGRPAATVLPADSARLCAGDSVQLTAPAGYGQYQWSTGATTAGIWVRAAGTYTVQVAHGGGCYGPASAPVVVRLTPRPAAPTITATPPASGIVVLTSSVATGNQWFLNGAPITGATGASYAVTTGAQSGTYTVQVTQRGCASPLSAPQAVTVTGLAAEQAGAALTLTPNPAREVVTLRSAAGLRAAALLDLAGRLIRQMPGTGEQLVLPLGGVPAGTYLVRVTLADGRGQTRRLVVAP